MLHNIINKNDIRVPLNINFFSETEREDAGARRLEKSIAFCAMLTKGNDANATSQPVAAKKGFLEVPINNLIGSSLFF